MDVAYIRKNGENCDSQPPVILLNDELLKDTQIRLNLGGTLPRVRSVV